MNDAEPDLQTLLLLHEISEGLNPEINLGIYAKLLGSAE